MINLDRSGASFTREQISFCRDRLRLTCPEVAWPIKQTIAWFPPERIEECFHRPLDQVDVSDINYLFEEIFITSKYSVELLEYLAPLILLQLSWSIQHRTDKVFWNYIGITFGRLRLAEKFMSSESMELAHEFIAESMLARMKQEPSFQREFPVVCNGWHRHLFLMGSYSPLLPTIWNELWSSEDEGLVLCSLQFIAMFVVDEATRSSSSILDALHIPRRDCDKYTYVPWLPANAEHLRRNLTADLLQDRLRMALTASHADQGYLVELARILQELVFKTQPEALALRIDTFCQFNFQYDEWADIVLNRWRRVSRRWLSGLT